MKPPTYFPVEPSVRKDGDGPTILLTGSNLMNAICTGENAAIANIINNGGRAQVAEMKMLLLID
jgi:hypothetical protein